MMRSHEIISEKQYPLRSGSTVDVAINPTHRKIGALLRDHKCVRGGIMDGRLFVWDGWFSSHQEIQRSMDWWFDSLLVFYETLDDMARDLDWTQSQIYKEDGFYFVISPGLSTADRQIKVLANGVSIGYFEHRENRESGGVIQLKDEYSHISFYESQEILTEKRYPLRQGGTIEIVTNPTYGKIAAMLRERGDISSVRGGILDGRLVIWDAFDASHDDIRKSMGWDFDNLLVFYPTLRDMEMFLDWTYGTVYKGDGFCFVTSTTLGTTTIRVLSDAKRIGIYIHPDDEKATVSLNPEFEHLSFYESKTEMLPVTDANIAAAKSFLMKKWIERWEERGARGEQPTDLSSSCKFSSLFAQAIFGGKLEGHEDHQYVRLGGNVIDLNIDAQDVKRLADPHLHDSKFWMNPDHRESMASCKPRVQQWVKEFRSTL